MALLGLAAGYPQVGLGGCLPNLTSLTACPNQTPD